MHFNSLIENTKASSYVDMWFFKDSKRRLIFSPLFIFAYIEGNSHFSGSFFWATWQTRKIELTSKDSKDFLVFWLDSNFDAISKYGRGRVSAHCTTNDTQNLDPTKYSTVFCYYLELSVFTNDHLWQAYEQYSTCWYHVKLTWLPLTTNFIVCKT